MFHISMKSNQPFHSHTFHLPWQYLPMWCWCSTDCSLHLFQACYMAAVSALSILFAFTLAIFKMENSDKSSHYLPMIFFKSAAPTLKMPTICAIASSIHLLTMWPVFGQFAQDRVFIFWVSPCVFPVRRFWSVMCWETGIMFPARVAFIHVWVGWSVRDDVRPANASWYDH